jgi:hypothetical protein
VRKGGSRALAKLMLKTFWKRVGPTLASVTEYEGRSPAAARRVRRLHKS